VLLETCHETYVFVEAKAQEKFRVARERVGVEPLIGAPYGAKFHVRGGKLVRETKAVVQKQEDAPASTTNNRDVVDDNSAQRVEQETIAEMRREGVSGEAIIETLVRGSTTFAEKTEFSKAKYLKRKEKKYLPWVRVLAPRASTVARAFFARANAKKNLVVRPDAIAQMLSRANVRPSIHVLCLDATGGVLVGALLERVGASSSSSGKVFVAHAEPHAPALDALRRFNFPKDLVRHAVRPFRVGGDSSEAMTPRSLVVASKHDPAAVLAFALPLLRPSSAFVVYCDTIEPLVPCFKALQASCVALQLTEAWVRDFQVLPGRTHPAMTASATGGFLLSGITTALSSSSSSSSRAAASNDDCENGHHHNNSDRSEGTTNLAAAAPPGVVVPTPPDDDDVVVDEEELPAAPAAQWHENSDTRVRS